MKKTQENAVTRDLVRLVAGLVLTVTLSVLGFASLARESSAREAQAGQNASAQLTDDGQAYQNVKQAKQDNELFRTVTSLALVAGVVAGSAYVVFVAASLTRTVRKQKSIKKES